jgi:methionyl aminopeptidase
MAISIKTPAEIDKMRTACRLAAEVLEMIEPYVQPGVSTEELDRICHDYIVKVQGAIPAPLNYRGFPKSICTSVNHQVCHGIPGPKRLKAGDIVNVDITVIKEGFHGDTSKMFLIGEAALKARRLVTATQEAMYCGIAQVAPGRPLNAIGSAIQQHAESLGFSVVREFCGHGIGRAFHEDPQILHYFDASAASLMQPGMIFTIEPMINIGKRHVKILPDGWTAVTKDHSLSAQWEHTVLVTEHGHDILTLRQEETREDGRTRFACA